MLEGIKFRAEIYLETEMLIVEDQQLEKEQEQEEEDEKEEGEDGEAVEERRKRRLAWNGLA